MTTEHDLVLVVDFGAQYAQLIARRVREARVYSEIVPHTTPIEEMLAKKPKAIILSGGPSSVYEPGAPSVNRAVFEAGVPVFGMCYGFQAMAQALGGEVRRTGVSEYGRTPVTVTVPGTLLADVPESHRVWMSHGDSSCRARGLHRAGHLGRLPGGRVREPRAPARRRAVAPGGAAHRARPGGAHALPAQHRRLPPDVDHGQHRRGADRADPRADRRQARDLRASGGVDSAVAAALVQRAIGDQLTCVFVDHGLLRKGEAEQVERDFVAATGVSLHVVDAQQRFLEALAGVSDPEEKRKIIGREFIRVFEAAEIEVIGEAAEHGEKVEFLVQGTLYPDVVESGGGAGTSNIKSHHNVGGLPEDLEFSLVEPLRTLFKDEVRLVGEQARPAGRDRVAAPFRALGLGSDRRGHPRPARDAARGGRDRPRGLTRAGLDRDIWQFPPSSWPTCGRSACRVTAGPMATWSCCGR